MLLQPYVENIQRQLVVAAEAGGEDAAALAERMLAPLEAAIRLTVQDALVAAAEEITCELAPGSVELRLRGRDPEFVVTPPPNEWLDDPPGTGVLHRVDESLKDSSTRDRSGQPAASGGAPGTPE